MPFECKLTQLKVFQECIRGISSELVHWIHKPPPGFISRFFQPGPGKRERALFEVKGVFFFRSPSSLSFLLSLRGKEDWVSLICYLYIWMCSEQRWSQLPDNSPGAETVAVANLFSAGAVYHGGAGHPLKMHACFQQLICGHEGQSFTAARDLQLERV